MPRRIRKPSPKRSGRPSQNGSNLDNGPAQPRQQSPKTRPRTDRLEGFAHPRETLRPGRARTLPWRAPRAPSAPATRRKAGCSPARRASARRTLAYRITRYMLAYGATRARRRRPGGARARAQRAAGHGRLASRPSRAQARLQRLRQADDDPVGRRRAQARRFLRHDLGRRRLAHRHRRHRRRHERRRRQRAAQDARRAARRAPCSCCSATRRGRLLPTIRSRCQRLELRPLDAATLEAELARLLPDLGAAARASLARPLWRFDRHGAAACRRRRRGAGGGKPTACSIAPPSPTLAAVLRARRPASIASPMAWQLRRLPERGLGPAHPRQGARRRRASGPLGRAA